MDKAGIDHLGNSEKISGIADNVIFENSDNGYIVFDLDCDGLMVTVNGNLGKIVPGEKLTLNGSYADTKYGKQFKAVTCERSRPETPEEIAKYIGSGIIPGIGVKTAMKIADKFGESTLEVIENTPERLREIKGITAEKAATIGATFRRLFGINSVLEFLSGYGISPATSVAVWNRYDNSSIALIKQNPFLLCEQGIDIDFESADKMAAEFGMDPFSRERIKAGISYILLENARIGHTCVPLKPLGEKVCEYLDISRDSFEIALYESAEEGRFSIHSTENNMGNCEWVYLASYFKAEKYIAGKLSEMLKLNAGGNRDFSEDIERVEFEESIQYEDKQKAAIQGCLEHNLFILTGGPGTGKTTALNAVIRLLKQSRKLISLAAPTGRAAKRMSELTGQPSQTIHRLLEVDASKESQNGMSVFKKNEMNPLKYDVIIIDEMSMVDSLLFESLLRAVKPSTKLIMAGDSDQLPSVGAGNILADLISCGKIEQIRLIEIFRQASQSLIITNAHKIVSGTMPELSVKDKDFFFMPCSHEDEIAYLVADLVKTRLPKAYGLDSIDDIQVLTPTKMGLAGTRELNKNLQLAVNPASMKKREIKYGDVVYRVGDKIMQTTNDYNVEWTKSGERGMGIFNGDIGIITGIDSHSGGISVNFDGRAAVIPPKSFNKIEHAYAITVHKSQGSEYRAVIMPISSVTRRLLYRSLLYTGVTRARDLLILIGKSETIAEMVNNEQKAARYSCLKEMLENAN